MKPNVDFPKKEKNSFIYFQLGLIATMVLVLFVLEFDFKTSKKKLVSNSPEIFEINEPSDYVIISEAKAVVPVKTSAPVSVFKNAFKLVNVEIPKEVEVVKETAKETGEISNEQPHITPSSEGENSDPITEKLTIFSVQSLPMFPGCKGISRAEQKACFDEQLAKFIMKHLVYPEDDLENGKQGVAQVEFVIDENGTITNVMALNNKRATLKMQKAAEKAIKRLPKLIPAMHGDKAVKIKYTIPVGFKIN